MKFSDHSDQYLTAEEKKVTYVSRIQCVQAAVDAQLNDMALGADKRKVGVVTFNGEVSIIGDGSSDPVIVTGDHLNHYEWLEENGKKQAATTMKNQIGQTKPFLAEKVMSIEETGPTALGPAVLTSIAMAAEGNPGSTVVLCTDGLANVGLGSWDDCKTPEDTAKVEEFYECIGQFAKSKGVVIHIVTLAGEECNLDSIEKIAEMSGGEV